MIINVLGFAFKVALSADVVSIALIFIWLCVFIGSEAIHKVWYVWEHFEVANEFVFSILFTIFIVSAVLWLSLLAILACAIVVKRIWTFWREG